VLRPRRMGSRARDALATSGVVGEILERLDARPRDDEAKVADAQAQGRGRMARAGGTHELQLARRIDASSRVQLNL
jgi:hypothetical protein